MDFQSVIEQKFFVGLEVFASEIASNIDIIDWI